MIVFLLLIIFMLCLAVIYLGIDAFRKRKIFKKRILALEDIIVQISKKQITQSNQLKLSDDLNENLKKSRTTLSNDIFDLNYELFDILSKNELLKK